AFAFAASSGGGSFADTPHATAIVAQANSLFFITPFSSGGPCRFASVRCHADGLAALCGDLAGLDVFVPVTVVLLRPCLVDIAVAHRRVGTAHAGCAEVGMEAQEADHQDGRGGVEHVRPLHGLPGVVDAG